MIFLYFCKIFILRSEGSPLNQWLYVVLESPKCVVGEKMSINFNNISVLSLRELDYSSMSFFSFFPAPG